MKRPEIKVNQNKFDLFQLTETFLTDFQHDI